MAYVTLGYREKSCQGYTRLCTVVQGEKAQRICGALFSKEGVYFPATSLGDLQLPIEQLGPASQWFKYDVERAKQMMAQAGYGAGFEVEFLGTAGYGPIWVSEMEFIAANMAKIGIKLNIKLVEYAEWLVTGHAGLYKDTAFGPMTPYLSIDEWTYGMLNSGSAANKCHCNDPKLDELTLKQRRTFDPKERRAVLEELQRYVHDQVVYIMPPLGYTNYAAREWVRDFYP